MKIPEKVKENCWYEKEDEAGIPVKKRGRKGMKNEEISEDQKEDTEIDGKENVKEENVVKKRGRKGTIEERLDLEAKKAEERGEEVEEKVVVKKRGRKGGKFEGKNGGVEVKEEDEGVLGIKRGINKGNDLKNEDLVIENDGVLKMSTRSANKKVNYVVEEDERVYVKKQGVRGSKKGNGMKNEDLVIENGQENGGVLKKRTRGANEKVNYVVEEDCASEGEDERVFVKRQGVRGRKKAKVL